MAKMPGVKVVEEEKVPETADVQKTMGSMITLDGATLLFPTSFGYFEPHVLKVATQYPKVTFMPVGCIRKANIPKMLAAISAISTRRSTSPV